jgi:Flp pilus assembly protein TadG
LLTGADGSQLLEFALGVPFLVVILIGILDFGAGFHLRQKLTNAAREGARIGISQPTADLTLTSCPVTGVSSPCTVQAIRDAVANYLTEVDLDASIVATNPTTGPGVFEWTYASTDGNNDPIIVIDRGFVFTATDGDPRQATRVQVSWRFTWTFANVIQLLGPDTYPGSFLITSEVVMENLT